MTCPITGKSARAHSRSAQEQAQGDGVRRNRCAARRPIFAAFVYLTNVMGAVRVGEGGNLFNRLADLIEPEERTCRMIDNGVELCCSECDGRHSYDDEPRLLHAVRSEGGGRMTNHEHYFGTPEAASRMEVRFLCHPIRVHSVGHGADDHGHHGEPDHQGLHRRSRLPRVARIGIRRWDHRL